LIKVAVQITRITDTDFPGWVECVLRDAQGDAWTFVEKVPVVTTEDLNELSAFPRPGAVACEVLAGNPAADDASSLVAISTSRPWGIAASDGTASFIVFRRQLLDA
jgi:hypothetical protein